MTIRKVGVEELIEEAIFSANQFKEIFLWLKDRQNYIIDIEVTGTWFNSEFLKAKGTLLRKFTSEIFTDELYLLLEEGELGAENILIGRHIVKIPSNFRKTKESLLLYPSIFVLRNSFKVDRQELIFFRGKEYHNAIEWLESFLPKYRITCLIDGILLSEKKAEKVVVYGTIKKVDNREFIIKVLDAFNRENPLNEEFKEFVSLEWVVQVSNKSDIGKVQPQNIAFQIGEELALGKKVLEVEDLSVKLGGKTIIHDVNFELNRGEILGIIGESGAGKSTALKAILGEYDYKGKIYLFGYNARDTKTVSPFIGYIPQDLSRMYGNFNALENIVSFGRQYGIPEDIIIQRGKKILEDLGIVNVANQPVDSLSGGQKRRVSIAISMVHNPHVIFLDEPTSGLDPQARYELWQYLDFINKEYDITLVVISHYLDEIEYCDKAAIFLKDIGFYDFGTPEELKKKLPGKGYAVEIEFKTIQLEILDILKDIKEIDFVIQRGERIRLLSNMKREKLMDVILATLEENHIPIDSADIKVSIDMIDYFTYVSSVKPETDKAKTKKNKNGEMKAN